MQEWLETQVWSLDWEDALEEGMATHSSILTWRIPWTEEPGGLWSMGSQRVGHDWATDLIWSDLFPWASQVVLVVKNPPANAYVTDVGSILGSGRCPTGGHGNPLQCSCLENPMNRGTWRAIVHRVTKSQTWLKRLSTHAHTEAQIHSQEGEELLSPLYRAETETLGEVINFPWDTQLGRGRSGA